MGTSPTTLWRKPDLVLVLMIDIMAAPSAYPGIGFAPLQHLSLPFLYRPMLPILVYFLVESVRNRAPLTGIAVGLWSGVLASLSPLAFEWWRSGHTSLFGDGTLSMVVPLVLLLALVGGVVGTIAWLATGRRQVPTQARHEPPTGSVLAACAVITLCLVYDSVAWAFQASPALVRLLDIGAVDHHLWPGWKTILTLDRLTVATLALLATYGLLRGRRWARVAVGVYLVAAAVIAAARVPVFCFLSGRLPAWPTVVNSQMSALSSRATYMAVYVELPLRILLCVLGLTYLRRSGHLARFLNSPPRLEPRRQTARS